jgi:hypothetical protein
MKNLPAKSLNLKSFVRVLMLVAGICTVAALTPRSSATGSLTMNVVNSGGVEIRHLYLSPADNDNWGADQLANTAINPGATRTLQISWDQSTVKLVAEDADGCFLTTTVDASGTSSWTITNDTTRDCGR